MFPALPVQRDPHGHHELGSGQVEISHHLSAGMFNLESGVELEEVIIAIRVIEILHSPGTPVPHQLRQAHGGRLHLSDRLLVSHTDGRLLDDLLVSPLNAAVAREDTDGGAYSRIVQRVHKLCSVRNSHRTHQQAAGPQDAGRFSPFS